MIQKLTFLDSKLKLSENILLTTEAITYHTVNTWRKEAGTKLQTLQFTTFKTLEDILKAAGGESHQYFCLAVNPINQKP